MWRPRGELRPRYDVVIVGAGSHGLATAYYLAQNHGITNVAVLDKSYIGSGAAGRNTTIIRSNYRTPEGAAFYKRSVELYEGLSIDLDFNLLFSQQGHLTLAHSDRAMITSRNGLTGSVTNAWRMCVVIGSGTPARSPTSVDQPAAALITVPHATSPRVVRTPVTRPPERSIPVTSVSGWISMPARSAPRAKPQTTASCRMIPPAG